MSINRREFLKLGLHSGLVYLSLQPPVRAFAFRPSTQTLDPSPLRSVLGPFSNSQFNGDEYHKPHHILWDLPAYIQSKGGRPAVSERREVVIVGGGVGGLSSAYFLQNKKPLVLEQASQFGGNSKGEVFENSAFSIGSAYLTVPTPGSSLHRMLATVGVLSAARHEPESDAKVFFRGRGFQSLWQGEVDPSTKDITAKIAQDLAQISRTAFPSIPWHPGGMNRRDLEGLDQLTLLAWLQQRYGNQIPPAVLEYLQLYCWSSFGGSIDEISAAQALNFLCAETEGLIAFPGGNSFVLNGLAQHLVRHLGADSLRANCMVLEVKATEQGTEVLYEDPSGQLRLVFCKACVVASPKYAARFMVPQMTREQSQLAERIEYRGYVVANVLLNQRVASPCFDAYCLEGKIPPTPRFAKPPRKAFSDVCFANWATGDRASRSILTLYRPVPYDGGRNILYDGPSFGRFQREISEQLPELLSALGVPGSAVAGLRLTRWGHALPLAEPGFFSRRQDEIFKTPTQGRIFYANQDNDVNPSFESAFENAEIAALQIQRMP